MHMVNSAGNHRAEVEVNLDGVVVQAQAMQALQAHARGW